MSIRCFHLRLKGTGCDGRTDVILDSIKASRSRVFPSFPKLVTFKLIMPCEIDCVVASSILLIFMPWWQHCRRRCYAKHSIMNDADDAKSNDALALVVWPSGLVTWNWHVISRTWWEPLNWDVCVAMTPRFFLCSDVASGTFASLSCILACSQGWWGFWHFLHLCTEEHCFAKWPALTLSLTIGHLSGVGKSIQFFVAIQSVLGCFAQHTVIFYAGFIWQVCEGLLFWRGTWCFLSPSRTAFSATLAHKSKNSNNSS